MWKIHGKIYDLDDFLDIHPGGRTILESSKDGIDCTASFESYHSMCDMNKINLIMKKYEIGECENFFMFKQNGFYDVLRGRVREYFALNNLSHHCNLFWIIKASLQAILYLIFFIISCYCHKMRLLLRMFCAFFSGHMFIQYGFSVMHEASHCAISSNCKYNETLSKIWNSLALWDFQLWSKHHCYWHHSFTGTKHDPDTLHFAPIIRKSIYENSNKYCKNSGYLTQKLVMFIGCIFPGLWLGQSIAYANWLYKKYLWRIKLGIYHFSFVETALKLFTLLSLIYSSSFLVAFSFIIACNITYFICIMPNHDSFETHINSTMDMTKTDWGEFQVRNSGNFATNNFLVNYCFGGINYQIEHHLFPTICHIHFPSIQCIVKKTCGEFNIQYVDNKNIYSAIKSSLINFEFISKQQ
jgi:linoleoyl-CoA desaturase